MLVANIILGPSRAEIIGKGFALVVVLDAQRMTLVASRRLTEEQLLGLGDAIRIERSHKELTVVDRHVIRRIGILHVVLSQHDAFLVLGMDDDTRSQLLGLCKTFVPYRHAVEVGAFIECHDTMFHNGVACHSRRLIVESHTHTHGTVVENLIVLKTVGIDQLAIDQECGSATSQRGSNLVEVHTTSMIVMIRDGAIEQVALGTVLLAHLFYTRHHHHILQPIALVDNQFGSVLRPHIGTVALLACTLQGRTIDAVGSAIVLPGKVVFTLRHQTTIANGRIVAWRTLADGESLNTLRPYAGIEQYLAVAGQLIRYFETCHITDDELTTSMNAQLVIDCLGVNLNHLLTELLALVLDSHFHRSGVCVVAY